MKSTPARSSKTNHDLHYVASLWLSILQIAASFFHRLTGIGVDIAATGDSSLNAPELPATYAFTIWLPIFVLSLVYGILQYLPKYRHRKIISATRNYASAIFLFSTIWMLIAQVFGNNWVLVITLALMFFYSLKAFFVTTNKNDQSKLNRFLTQPLFGLYAGWLSAAVYLNFSSMLRIDTDQFNLSDNQFSLFTFVPFALTALIIIFKTKFTNIWYSAAITWAVVAILAKFL